MEFVYFIIGNFLELIFYFRKLDSKTIIFNSTDNKNYNFNSKYLFQYFLEFESDYKVFFVINDERKRKDLIDRYGDFFINTTSFSGLLIVCRAKVWVSSVLETPYFVLPILKNRERIIYHVGHGVPLKKIGLSEEKITFIKYVNRYLRTRLFTHVLSYSSYCKSIMIDVFRNKNIDFVYFGQPRNDQFSNLNNSYIESVYSVYPQLKKANKLVLYAPTWRSYSKTKFFPFEGVGADELNRILVENGIFILLREHPFYSSDIDDAYLNKSNILFFNSDFFSEIMDYLPIFDGLITDYSSIYLDYLCLNRPVAFIPYDIEVYGKVTGFSMDYDEITPGSKLHTFEEFMEFLLAKDDQFSSDRRNVGLLMNAKNIDNCRENAEFIKSLIYRKG